MNHLTDEQLSDWLAGEPTSETAVHLRQCESCQREAAALRDDISRYAIAVRRHAANAQESRMKRTPAPARDLTFHRLRWAGATALALLLGAQTVWMLRPHAPTPAPQSAAHTAQPAAAQTISDDELLEEVNNDLNRDVPQALAPVSAITVARNRMAASTVAGSGNVSSKEGERE